MAQDLDRRLTLPPEIATLAEIPVGRLARYLPTPDLPRLLEAIALMPREWKVSGNLAELAPLLTDGRPSAGSRGRETQRRLGSADKSFLLPVCCPRRRKTMPNDDRAR